MACFIVTTMSKKKKKKNDFSFNEGWDRGKVIKKTNEFALKHLEYNIDK